MAIKRANSFGITRKLLSQFHISTVNERKDQLGEEENCGKVSLPEVGAAWVAGSEVYTVGLNAGAGKVLFRIARLHRESKVTQYEAQLIVSHWIRLGRTLTPDEVDVLVFANALSGKPKPTAA